MKNILRVALLTSIGSLVLAACVPAWRGMPGGQGWWENNGNFASNGEQIYFTATNDRGEAIRYTGGPVFGGMMRGNLTCVSCHGADGRGGEHLMRMDIMDAPDIRYQALMNDHDEDEHAEGEEEAHPGEYGLETFRNAVVLGQHPDGDSLDRDMPRWQLSDDDLADLLEFLKTLP